MSAQLQFHEPALVRVWTPEVYFRQDEYVSRSELYKLADSIAMFLYPEPREVCFRGESLGNKPAAMGVLVHCGVLEWGVFKAKVIPFAKTERRGSQAEPPVSSDDEDPPLDHCAMLSEGVEAAVSYDLEQRPLSKDEIKQAKAAAAEEKKRIAAEKKAATAAKKAAKEAKEAEVAALLRRADDEDLWLVPPHEIARAEAIMASIWDNPKVAEYLRGEALVHGQACVAVYSEVAITWVDPESGVRCRALLDRVLVYPHCIVILDLKTDRHTPNPERWGDRAVSEWLYEQAQFYCRGASLAFGIPATFAWIVAKNNAPFVAAFHQPYDEELAAAKRTNDALLQRLARLMDADDDAWRDRWSLRINRVRPSPRSQAILEARALEAEEVLDTESSAA